MLQFVKILYHRQIFFPNWLGIFINPFYFARSGLRDAMTEFANCLSGRLLDVGCGSKPYHELFTVENYIGLDIDSKNSRDRGVADELYDGNEFPFLDNSFDSVLCNQVLEHVFNPNEFLGQIARILKPGGKLLLTVPFVWDEHEQPFDYARYSSFGLRALLEKNGFVICQHKKLGADASILFQLANAYIYKITQSWPRLAKFILMATVMAFINFLGVIAAKLLPSNPDLFLDHVVLAEKSILNSYNSKQVLITGGLGFIGSNLARTLVAQGAIVTLVDSLIPQYGGNVFNIEGIRDKVTVNVCDVRDPFAMAYLLQGKDYLFNLAGQTSHIDSMSDPQTDLDINASAQLSILEACRKTTPDIKIVFASTRQLYGKPDYLPVDEKHPVRPVDVNGINKLAGEWYHLLYNNVYGIRSCALRLTNTYGPGMRVKDARQTFLGIWVRLLIEGKPIRVFGDGMQLRDFNYVDDCVEALLLAGASEAANGKVFNLGSSEVVGLKALAEMMVADEHNASFELVPFPPERKAIDIGDYYSDFSLITRELGWKPKVDLREGLERTMAYYQKHHQHYWPD